MATVSNTLYPPIVSTYMPAFPYNENAVVYFSISPFNSPEDIKFVHVSLVDQRTNENAFEKSSIMIYDFWGTDMDTGASVPRLLNGETGLYGIEINPNMVKGGFNTNQYYKVQLRFDTTDALDTDGIIYDSSSLNIDSINEYLFNNTENFSEWSTVCLIRPIPKPTIKLTANFNPMQSDLTFPDSEVKTVEPGDIWVVGSVEFGNGSSQDSETLERYKVSIVDEDGNLVGEESKTHYPSAEGATNQINTNVYLNSMGEANLFLLIDAITTNGYRIKEKYSPFILNNWLEEVDFKDFKISEDKENGRIRISATAKTEIDMPFGKIIIRRTDDRSKFKKWDKIKTIKIVPDKENRWWKRGTEEDGAIIYTLDIALEDNTIGSMNWYKYSFQFVNENEVSSKPFITETSYYSDFEYAIFSRGRTQLSVKYNFDISSYKPVVSRAKVDTLGGKYPKFAENAVLGYRQFSISGKISSQEDERNIFISKDADDENTPYSYKDYVNSFARSAFNDYYEKKNNAATPVYKGFVESDSIFIKNTLFETDVDNSDDIYKDCGNGVYIKKEYLYSDENNSLYELISYENEDSIKEGVFKKSIEDDIYETLEENYQSLYEKYFTSSKGEYAYYYIGYITAEREGNLVTYDDKRREVSHYIYEHGENGCYEKDPWLDYHDWLWERKFREAAIAWLNDGEPKLMRTLTEGNVCVMLMDVNLTPERTLYRRLYNFTATAYEVGDGYDLETLDALGIYDVVDESKISYEDLINGIENNSHLEKKEPKPGSFVSFNLEAEKAKIGISSKNFVEYVREVENKKYLYCLNSIPTTNFSLQDVKIQFLNPPHAFLDNNGKVETLDAKRLIAIGEKDEKFSGVFTGYRIKITLEGSDEPTEIYVNPSGYYQIPDGIKITSLEFENSEDVVDIEYIQNWNRTLDTRGISKGSVKIKDLAAQERRTWQLGKSVAEIVNKKHYLNGNGWEQRVPYWTGVIIEALPYTLVQISFKDGDPKKFEIGRTGILNLRDKDLEITDMTFIAREKDYSMTAARESCCEAESADDYEYKTHTCSSDEEKWRGHEKSRYRNEPVDAIVNYFGEVIRYYI